MADRFSRTVPALPELNSGRKKELAAFQKTAGIRFKSQKLLNLSFMHRSVSNESNNKINNERLEFLGDAILGAVTVTLLYDLFPDRSEGDLAKIKSVVVSEEILSGISLELGLDRLLILGKGEDHSGGRTKKAILADALEALIGAYYLDSGYKAAFAFVRRFIQSEIDLASDRGHSRDFKTLLQEYSQRLYRSYPAYRLIRKTGPEHEKMFWVEVMVNGKSYGPGSGKNKKSAEQEAARFAYEELALKKEPRPAEQGGPPQN
ncbi:MAG: ribonuclease III [Spirochaetaceae bacterium]|jgi:ribonuclease-3|nr:ribonuclease III [Spirochaetaceae bacterium]